MFRVIIRGHLAHPFRLALLVLAVLLGVSFMAATLEINDAEHAGLALTSAEAFDSVSVAIEGPGITGRTALPAALLAEIGAIPGVGAAQGVVSGPAQVVRADGSAIGSPSASTIGVSLGPVRSLNAVHLVQGRLPAGADDAVVDVQTFENQGWHLGQRVEVAALAPVRTFRIVGTVAVGSTDQVLGSSVVGFSLAEAQREFDLGASYSTIVVHARAGTSPATLASRIKNRIGTEYLVLSGSEFLAQQRYEFGRALPSIGSIFGVLIGVVLFAGALVIFNALSMVVAARRRELALLRCLGASRVQVLRAVLAEAAAIGAVASAIGLVLGLVAGSIIQHRLAATSQSLGAVGPVVSARTIIVCLVVGIVISVAASLVPARQAAGAAPLEAFRLDAPGELSAASRVPRPVAWFVGVLGLLLMGLGLFGHLGSTGVVFGVGLATALLAVGIVGPTVIGSVLTIVAWPWTRLGGVARFLGQANAVRNPRRTARTTWALVISVALVSFLGIIANSARASTDQQLDQSLSAAFVLQHTGDPPLSTGPNGSIPLSPTVLARLEADRDLEVSPFEYVAFNGGYGAAVDPATISHLIAFHGVRGSIARLDHGGLAVSGLQSLNQHIRLGERLPVTFGVASDQRTGHLLPVVAVYHQGDHESGYLFSLAAVAPEDPSLVLNAILVSPRAGVELVRARSEVERALAGFPEVALEDQSSVRAGENQDINRQIDLLSGLLLLAIVIGVLGLANTLALSVFEREHELATLRAVGMSRRQVRSMVYTEAALVGLLGAVAGVVLGLFLGWAFQRTALVSQGVTHLAVPWVLLALYALAGTTVGVLSGSFPAWRASRLRAAAMLAALAVD